MTAALQNIQPPHPSINTEVDTRSSVLHGFNINIIHSIHPLKRLSTQNGQNRLGSVGILRVSFWDIKLWSNSSLISYSESWIIFLRMFWSSKWFKILFVCSFNSFHVTFNGTVEFLISSNNKKSSTPQKIKNIKNLWSLSYRLPSWEIWPSQSIQPPSFASGYSFQSPTPRASFVGFTTSKTHLMK